MPPILTESESLKTGYTYLLTQQKLKARSNFAKFSVLMREMSTVFRGA